MMRPTLLPILGALALGLSGYAAGAAPRAGTPHTAAAPTAGLVEQVHGRGGFGHRGFGHRGFGFFPYYYAAPVYAYSYYPRYRHCWWRHGYRHCSY